MSASILKTIHYYICFCFKMAFGLGIPFIKSRSESKLHISKTPSLKSWIFFFGFILVSAYFIDYITVIWVKCILMVAVIIISFMQLNTYEDWIFDYKTSNFFYMRYNLIDKLRNHASRCKMIPLSRIIDVQVVMKSGLILLFKNGERLPVAPNTVNLDTLQILRYHISSFLKFEQVEFYKPVVIGEINGHLVKVCKPGVDVVCAIENGRNSFRSSVRIGFSSSEKKLGKY